MGISDDIINQIQRALNAGISGNSLKDIAKDTAKSVQTRSRLGKSVVKDGANVSRLEQLKPTYKKQRKGLKKGGKLSNKTTPNKSNLTKSGSMLNNIKSRTTTNGFEIYINGEKNQEKAKYVQKNRPFMFLAKFEIKLIIESIIDRIRRSK